MPSLARITNTFFVSLINRLGIRPPPPEGFEISSVVQPVSIVDSDIAIPATVSTTLMDTPFTGGEIVTPAAGALLADSGSQPAGNYNVVITVGQDNFNAGQGSFRVARRNATNLADIWSALFTLEDTAVLQIRIVLALSERIRVIWGPTVATGTVQANIWIALS